MRPLRTDVEETRRERKWHTGPTERRRRRLEMAADDMAPARAVWRLGDYHRFAREQMSEIGPVVVAACGITPRQRVAA